MPSLCEKLMKRIPSDLDEHDDWGDGETSGIPVTRSAKEKLSTL